MDYRAAPGDVFVRKAEISMSTSGAYRRQRAGQTFPRMKMC